MSIADGKLTFDITTKPIGYWWGANNTAVSCPVCAKPALLLPRKLKRKGETIAQYAHVVRYELDAANDAKLSYGAPCEHNETQDKAVK